MNLQALIEPKSIDDLVLELALALEEYPKTGKQEKDEKARAILKLADNLDQSTYYGQKQEPKDDLIDLLGYRTNDYKVTSAFRTISSAIVYLTDIGVKDIGKVVTRLPQVLALDVEKKMKPRVEYLKSIGVKDEDIGKVVTRLPQVLALDVEKTMKPRVEYLKSIGVKDEDIGKVVTKLPQVLGYDVEKTMKPRVEYLKSIGVKDEDIGKVVTRLPQVLALDVEKTMKPRVEYLKSIGVKDKDIGKVVTRLTQVLEYDVENNLKPTYEFLKDKFGAAVDTIVRTPAYLSYSLNGRIKPRHAFLESKGLINGSYANVNLLKPSDENFCKRLKVPLQEYLEFKQNYLQQQKAKANTFQELFSPF